MYFTWQDYDPETMGYIESWLDEDAVKATGLDEGFQTFYAYWAGEADFAVGENFWCKVVSEADAPVAAVAFCRNEEKTVIMELLVRPEKRGRGIGTKLLRELLENEKIAGFLIRYGEAAVFPGNTASRKAFENAGFRHQRTHPDGDALYYVYERG